MGRSVKGSKKSSKSTASAPVEEVANMATEQQEESAMMARQKEVKVPYGSPYSKEQQAVNVQRKVKDGLNDLMSLVRNGAEACVDRAAVVEMASKLDRQADGISAALAKDNVYIEEVRHHHNRISDLCDDTRAYAHAQMVADLKRAAAIRVNVMTIVQGKAPEFELEQEELDELKSVRLMLRRKFGAKDRGANGGVDPMSVGPTDQSQMTGVASEVKAIVPKVFNESAHMSAEAFEDAARGQAYAPGTWAEAILAGEDPNA